MIHWREVSVKPLLGFTCLSSSWVCVMVLNVSSHIYSTSCRGRTLGVWTRLVVIRTLCLYLQSRVKVRSAWFEAQIPTEKEEAINNVILFGRKLNVWRLFLACASGLHAGWLLNSAGSMSSLSSFLPPNFEK